MAASLETASANTIAAPVIWHGNLLKVSRGETVFNEVLGAGNSSIA